MFKTHNLPAPWNSFVPFAITTFVWGLFFVVLFVLRSFFLLIFLTFVFAYIQNSAVNASAPKIRTRPLRVTLVGVGFLTILVLIGLFLVPRIRHQAEVFAKNFGTYVENIDQKLGQLATDYPAVAQIFAGSEEIPGPGDENVIRSYHSRTTKLVEKVFGIGADQDSAEGIKAAIDTARNIGVFLWNIGSAFLLALLFSFLIVLDLPNLTQGVKSLASTRVGFIYDEVADSLYNFGRIMGQALQAQLLIAALNTIMTYFGLWILGLTESMAFLSLIVFLCGFIPVAGVFISSVPICLLALEKGGFVLALGAALLIWIIHMTEAYVLNPKIYGQQLRINAVLVLIILTIGGKLFGVWGLVLGLPICTYIFRYAIRSREKLS